MENSGLIFQMFGSGNAGFVNIFLLKGELKMRFFLAFFISSFFSVE